MIIPIPRKPSKAKMYDTIISILKRAKENNIRTYPLRQIKYGSFVSSPNEPVLLKINSG